MTERKRFTRSTQKLQLNILKGGDTPYVNKDSRDWLFSQRDKWFGRIMRMTISEYNKTINKNRPSWIVGFSERKISPAEILEKSDIYFQSVTGDGKKKWYLERELIETDGNRQFAVERKLDYRRSCKRLVMLIPEQDDEYRYRQEERKSIEPWRVTKEFVFKPTKGFRTDRDFFQSIKSWSETISKQS